MRCHLVWLLVISTALRVGAQDSWRAQLDRAEKAYAEGSYQLAHEAYSAIPLEQLPPDQQRSLRFRLADSLWRSERSTQTADDTKIQRALQELRELVGPSAPKDATWAEVQESLGDYHWTTRASHNWGGAWSHYQQALEYWGGSTNLNTAAENYLEIVWKASHPPQAHSHYYYGYYGNYLPLDVLENALELARDEEEQARANFLVAVSLRHGGQWEQRRAVPRHFEQAIQLKRDTEWYDDALYHYAEWMSNNGHARRDEHGNWRFEPDYVKALELFRRIVAEYAEGETRYYSLARSAITNITRAEVRVHTPHAFTPETNISFELSWRNVKQIDLKLYKLNLVTDIALQNKSADERDWLQSVTVDPAAQVKEWSKDTQDAGRHIPGHETIQLEEKLEPGAYLLMASSGETTSRELIIVTEAALVIKASNQNILLYFCSAADGSPIAGGNAAVWVRQREKDKWVWRRFEGRTDENGLAEFKTGSTSRDFMFAAAGKNHHQALASANLPGLYSPGEGWRIYAYTDRPAYRPGETVRWKATARWHDGQKYTNPAGKKLTAKVTDPRGAEIKVIHLELNSFGSAWGDFPLTSEMPLGQYRVTFWEGDHSIGQAILFRLEEYKLPEFKVTVSTPEENGRKKTFLLGETVEVEVLAEYYFGGPVANATVEVVVRQSPFYHYWRSDHEFDWFMQREDSRRHYDSGQEVQRETLQTDASGRTMVKVRTSAADNRDMEYRIEARVTDSSRREVTGSSSVRVTTQRYYVQAEPDHYLHRPQDQVELEFKAVDANQHPVRAEGTVRITRDRWVEVWINPQGREVSGAALEALKGKAPFPPLERGWRLKFKGYEHDHILTRTLETGTNGLAELAFTPEWEGYYRVTWRSEEEFDRNEEIVGRPVHAETAVWVVSNTSTHIGYHTGGVEIILDKATLRAGETAPVMLVTSGNDRHVLFTVEGGEVLSHELIHMSGRVKLVHLPLDEKHVPNVRLGAVMVQDYEVQVDSEELIVPPVQNFLTVNIEPGKDEYQPGEKGEFTVRVTDHSGEPVQGEVALSVVDESVFYIQEDLAGDPRKFFFGDRKQILVRTDSSIGFRSFVPRELLVNESAEELSGDFAADRLYYSRNAYRERREQATPAPAAAVTRGMEPLLGKMSLGDVVGLAAQVPAQAGEDAVQVRSDFRATIFWQPDLITDESGVGRIELTYPDSLTGWKTTARAATRGNEFGLGTAGTRTKKPLIVRLQAPRFFLVGDTVTVSAVLNNNTKESMEVAAELRMEGLPAPASSPRASVLVPAGGEKRVDWVLNPQHAGEAKITVIARGGKHNDAMQKTFPVFEHGIEKLLALSGKMKGDEAIAILDLPLERKPGTTTMTVQVTPSLAVTMLDALPYLIDYPYGCTEQTMSRFLPAVITANTLKKLGLHPEDVMSRVFGGIEPKFASGSHPEGKRSLDKLDEIVSAGLRRLSDFQHSDGGWGWWKEGDSDPFMTAYVLWGLVLARDAEVEVRPELVANASKWLQRQLVEAERSLDLQAWMLHALSVRHHLEEAALVHPFENAAFQNLWENREQLNAYTRALLALAAHHYGNQSEAKTLLRNLENGVKLDQSPSTSVLVQSGPSSGFELSTAHWGEDGIFWRWSEGGVEATAFALKALVAIDPEHRLVEPVMNWLIRNRRGAQWSNTRDTAICLLALNEYLRQSGELETKLEYQLQVNGKTIAEKAVSRADLFSAPSRFEVPADLVRSRKNEIRLIRKSGDGPLYFAAEAEFFSLEEPIKAAGNEIFAKREYYRLKATPTLLKGFVYSKEKLNDGDRIASGDRLEVVLTVEAKNNYEYLVFEDLKPAGLEAVEVRSGQSLRARELKSSAVEERHGKTEVASNVREPAVRDEHDRAGQTGRSRSVYQELRDRKIALFLDKLPQGIWEIRYELRAETPGEFHALPVLGHAMYVP